VTQHDLLRYAALHQHDLLGYAALGCVLLGIWLLLGQRARRHRRRNPTYRRRRAHHLLVPPAALAWAIPLVRDVACSGAAQLPALHVDVCRAVLHLPF
jgi:hypothetical protein